MRRRLLRRHWLPQARPRRRLSLTALVLHRLSLTRRGRQPRGRRRLRPDNLTLRLFLVMDEGAVLHRRLNRVQLRRSGPFARGPASAVHLFSTSLPPDTLMAARRAASRGSGGGWCGKEHRQAGPSPIFQTPLRRTPVRRLCILTALAPPFLKEFAEGGLNLLRVPAVDAVNGLSAQRVVLRTDHTQGTCSILPKASRRSKISNPTPFKCMSHRAGPRDKTGEQNIIWSSTMTTTL